MSEKTRSEITRRRMFAGAGTAGALAAAAALLPKPAVAPAPGEAAPDGDAAQGGGYQVTQHVLRYYQTTRV